MEFEWDDAKNVENLRKHGVSFYDAQSAFFDPGRVIAVDVKHTSGSEKRYFCFGKTDEGILTVRFTIRSDKIRIIGAGYWREGKRKYEEKNGV